MTLADQAAITGQDGQVTSSGKPGRPEARDVYRRVQGADPGGVRRAARGQPRARRAAAERAGLPFSPGGLEAAAGRRFPEAGREERKGEAGLRVRGDGAAAGGEQEAQGEER